MALRSEPSIGIERGGGRRLKNLKESRDDISVAAESVADAREGESSEKARRLIELLGELIEPLHAEGHQALAQLSLAVESMEVALRGKEREVKTLQKSVSQLGKARSALEGELLRARETKRSEASAENRLLGERDRALSQLHGLEVEVTELRAQVSEMASQLDMEQICSEQARQREERCQTRCAELEEELDEARDAARSLQRAGVAREGQLRQAAAAARSHCAYASEQAEVMDALLCTSSPSQRGSLRQSGLRERQLPDVPEASVGESLTCSMEQCRLSLQQKQSQLQQKQSQLEKLRQVRDDLLKVSNKWDSSGSRHASSDSDNDSSADGKEDGDDEDIVPTPQERLLQRRCSFLKWQLAALVSHMTSLEKLLDAPRLDAPPRRASASAASLQSRVAPGVATGLSRSLYEEATAKFSELEERLHTLEVQKLDADQELQRSRRLIHDLEAHLKALQKQRDDLLRGGGGGGGLSIRAKRLSAACLPPGSGGPVDTNPDADAISDISTKTPGDQSSSQATAAVPQGFVDDGFLFGSALGASLKMSPKCLERRGHPANHASSSVMVKPTAAGQKRGSLDGSQNPSKDHGGDLGVLTRKTRKPKGQRSASGRPSKNGGGIMTPSGCEAQ